MVAWISAGGATREVLEGMDRTLERTFAVFVQVEADEVWSGQWRETQVAAHLLSRGFVLVGADRMAGRRQFGLVLVHRRFARRPVVARLAASVFRPGPRRAPAGGRGAAAQAPTAQPPAATVRRLAAGVSARDL